MSGQSKHDRDLAKKQIEWYREFHRYPELSMNEFRTTGRIKEILRELGVNVLSFSGGVGVVGQITGSGPGPEVVLRADMDALPIHEAGDVSFRSVVDEVSHMCGHDFHMAALLGAAARLVGSRHRWKGSVKLIFQPAEETTEGARYMIDHGAITGREAAIFGLHNSPDLPAGTVGLRSGGFFASADTLHIRVHGVKGHASMPHRAVDATVVASAIVMALQTVVSRHVNPLEPAVVTIGSLHSGMGHNVISDEADMWGTIRALSTTVQKQLRDVVSRIVRQVAEAYEARVKVDVIPKSPVVHNDPGLTAQLRKCFGKIAGDDRVLEVDPIMAAEDFAVFQQYIPGCYFLVGTRDPDQQVIHPWHHPEFRANESVLPLASSLLVQAALSQLAPECESSG